MRRISFRSLPLALAGLALGMPSFARAGNPEICATCAGQAKTPHAHKIKAKKVSNLCAACASKAAMASGLPVTVATSGACSECSATAYPVPTTALGSAPGTAPGYAVIGDPSPAPVLASSDAPGHAVVGGTMPSAEPLPMGVMRTNYRSAEMPGTLGASAAAAARGGPQAAGGIPYAKPGEVPSSLYTPQGRRRHKVLSRVIGLPDFGRGRAEADMRRREAHAMTSFGPQTTPAELPASMVYGGNK